MRLVKFIGRSGRYDFPEQTDMQDNFKNLVTRTTRMYQMDGAIDEYNGLPAPQELGNLSVTWWLFGNNGGTIQKAKEAVFAMTGWKAQRLFIQPEMEKAGTRWAIARINNSRGNENVKNQPHLRQTIQANYQINYPAWQGTVSKAWHLDNNWYLDDGQHIDGAWYLDDNIRMDGGWSLDDGLELDAGLYLDGTGYLLNDVRLEAQVIGKGEVTVSNWGNHTTRPVITLGARTAQWRIGDGTVIGQEPPVYFGVGGGNVRDILFETWQDGRMVDTFRYGGDLTSGQVVVIDALTNQVIKHTDGIYTGWDDFERVSGFGIPRLVPGETTFKISGDFDSEGCYVSVEFFDAWY